LDGGGAKLTKKPPWGWEEGYEEKRCALDNTRIKTGSSFNVSLQAKKRINQKLVSLKKGGCHKAGKTQKRKKVVAFRYPEIKWEEGRGHGLSDQSFCPVWTKRLSVARRSERGEVNEKERSFQTRHGPRD